MKIAYITLKGMPYCGGIEKYTEEVGSRLAAKGHEVTVYTMRHYSCGDSLYRGMKIMPMPSLRGRSFEKLSAAFTATLRESLCGDADVVHFHAFGPAAFCFIPRLLGRKVVVQGHGIEWQRARWGGGGRLILKLLESPSVRFPHHVTAVSKVQKAYMAQQYGRECSYIPTGVNPAQREEPNLIRQLGLRGDDYILFASRLVPEKGVHHLLKAYRQLDTPLKLVVAGDACYEAAYKDELRKIAGANGNIIFTGFATGNLLCELLTNCYLFVHPSEVEGLSTVLLEAMSYGNCCLVSDIPENLEALNGLGYSFRNRSVADLTEKLDVLIHDRLAVETFKERAKEHVLANHSWDGITEDLEALYGTHADQLQVAVGTS